VARTSWCTEDVSHRSKPLSKGKASPAGKAGKSKDDLADSWISLVRDEPGPTFVEDDE
jgi:hypothetical protein